ncbi:MAG: phytanoyl-CoA dioxygenase family protein [Chitinophagales bacterium]
MRDNQLQAQFEQEGYCVVSFYDQNQIDALTGLYNSLRELPDSGFFPTTFLKDPEVRETINQRIQAIAATSLQRHFIDIKVVNGSFIVKFPSGKSELRMHQDMSLVDESKFCGVNVWCPLVSLTPNNGALYVLPRSHRLVPTYRGASIPNCYDRYAKNILPYLKPLYLEAGQAVVFDQSILHYSPNNRSTQLRVATNIFITQKAASFRMYYFDRAHPDSVEVFEQKEDFMTQFQQFGYDIYARPTMGTSLGFTPYNFPELTPEHLQASYGPAPTTPIWKKLQQLWNR